MKPSEQITDAVEETEETGQKKPKRLKEESFWHKVIAGDLYALVELMFYGVASAAAIGVLGIGAFLHWLWTYFTK